MGCGDSAPIGKNKILIQSRGVSFETVLERILSQDFLGPEENPSRPGQYRIVLEINGYPHVVPLVIDNKGNWFLKTIYPSRKKHPEQNRTDEYSNNKIRYDEAQKIARREGLPYQTLVSGIIHKYIEGSFVDIHEAKKILKLQPE